MKQFKMALAIFCAAALLTACNGNKKADDKNASDSNATKTTTTTTTTHGTTSKLEGTWEVKREDSDPHSETVGSTYEFKGNKLTTAKDGFRIPGTVEVTDNTFSFLMDGGTDKIMYNYHFDGDTLVVTMKDGFQVFRMVKK